MLKLPIPTAPEAERRAIAELAERCLEAGGAGPRVAEWEAAINERVAWLYGIAAE
jgi:hypothetical protein